MGRRPLGEKRMSLEGRAANWVASAPAKERSRDQHLWDIERRHGPVSERERALDARVERAQQAVAAWRDDKAGHEFDEDLVAWLRYQLDAHGENVPEMTPEFVEEVVQ